MLNGMTHPPLATLDCLARRAISLSMVIGCALLIPVLSPTFAQVVADEENRDVTAGNLADAGDWPLEEIELADGKLYRGLIQAKRDHEIDFVEIHRPRGKPMFLVIRAIDARSIVRRLTLSAAEHRRLADRIQKFRNRSRIEAGRMEEVELAPATRGGVEYLRYQGTWFTLDSTADDETTRRSIIRLEQIFLAYRQLFPPRATARGNLRIVLYGSLNQYEDFLRSRGLEIRNPAFYDPRENLIVAGSQLTRFAGELAASRLMNEQTRAQYRALAAEIDRRLISLSGELRRQGVANDQIAEELKIRRLVWESEHQEAIRQTQQADRQNAERFATLTREMFRRLYHEAFHAYLENYVYPQARFHVPRWLNEGLAQTFESGQLEDDALRIDAPNREALVALRRDLAEERPLSLLGVVTSTQQSFLAGHDQAGGELSRHYHYSWGLAWYLAFHLDALDAAALDRYVRQEEGEQVDPIARFEQLVGQPLDQFERRWLRAMAELKPAPR